MKNIFNSNWENPESEDRLNIVFENRHIKYGAYQVRRQYARNKVWATLLATCLISCIVAIPMLASPKPPKTKVVYTQIDTYCPDTIICYLPKEDEKNSSNMTGGTGGSSMNSMLPPTIGGAVDVFGNINNTYRGNGGDNRWKNYDGTSGNDSLPEKRTVKEESNISIAAHPVNGEVGFRKYVEDNFIFPSNCQDLGVTGFVRVRFKVRTDGKLDNIEIVEQSASCPEFGTEAIRLLRNADRWIPAMVKGKYVNSWREIPIRLGYKD